MGAPFYLPWRRGSNGQAVGRCLAELKEDEGTGAGAGSPAGSTSSPWAGRSRPWATGSGGWPGCGSSSRSAARPVSMPWPRRSRVWSAWSWVRWPGRWLTGRTAARSCWRRRRPGLSSGRRPHAWWLRPRASPKNEERDSSSPPLYPQSNSLTQVARCTGWNRGTSTLGCWRKCWT